MNTKEYNRQYYLKNKEKLRANNSVWKETNLQQYIFLRAKQGARSRGILFDITPEDIIIPEKCPILDIPLYLKLGIGRSNNSPSLDRIDNNKGYTKDNIQVISWLANNIKGNRSKEELIDFCIGYLKFHNL